MTRESDPTMTLASRRARRRRGPSRGDLRERAILDAAERLIERHGFDGISMEAIAQEVGITRSSLYFYFDSRQSVATALFESIYAELIAPVNELRTAAKDDDSFGKALDRVAQLWREHRVVMRYAAQRGSDNPRIGELWRTAMERWVAATLAMLRSQPDSAATEHHARAMTLMIERSLWQLHSTDHTDADEQAVLKALKDVGRAYVDSLRPAA
jgi:AcrR family transcriptional regulator